MLRNILSYLNLQSLARVPGGTARARVLVVFKRSNRLSYEDIFEELLCKHLGKPSTKFNKIFLRILSRLTKNVIK